MLTPTQYERLPVYAQRHIDLIEMRLNEAKSDLANIVAHQAGDDFPCLELPYYADTHLYLPIQTVKMYTADKKYLSLDYLGDRTFDVHASKRVSVIPLASNHVEIVIND